MTQKRIIYYTISRLGYERQDGHFWRNFETAKTFRRAKKWARKIGAGAIIRRLERTRSGKPKVAEWEYVP